MGTESAQQFRPDVAGMNVERQVACAWRKADQKPIAFPTARVCEVIVPVANDGRAPHGRLGAGDVGEQLQERFGVFALLFIFDRVDEFGHTCCRLFCL